jgi:hypothetical protein
MGKGKEYLTSPKLLPEEDCFIYPTIINRVALNTNFLLKIARIGNDDPTAEDSTLIQIAAQALIDDIE